MKHLAIGFLFAIVGFLALAFLGYLLILYASDKHDRKVEASMTGLFIFGPIGFIIAFIIGYFWSKH
jgi:uncharacterized membrane protein